MQKTTLIIGPPGTGKTTRLINEVEKAIEKGIPTNRIAYLAFTRKAAEEAVDRAVKKFNLKKKDFPYFRTIHSLAFGDLGITKQEVMAGSHIQELANFIGGYDFKYQYNTELERMPMAGGLGDKCYSLYSMHRATKLPLETIWKRYADIDISLAQLNYFSESLEKFKRQKFLLDFTDFLDHSKLVLDVDLLIIDEAQDLTTQQWDYIEQIGKFVPERIVAGDDDQAIFQWAGADLNHFLKLKAERIVLPKSYRLPKKIWNVANGISGRIKNRYEKEWSPRDEEGTVKRISEIDDIDLSTGDWMILARNQFQIEHIQEVIHQHGYPYKVSGKSSLRKPYVHAIVYYERLRKGEAIEKGQLELVRKYCSKISPLLSRPRAEWPDWMSMLDGLSGREKEYVRSCLRKGAKLGEEPRIKINTIHAVKGGEADNVIVFPDITGRIKKELDTKFDEEARVWYVAASRAKQALYITEPKNHNFFDI